MTNKPNLLFLLTDQQRADTLSCYGNDHIQVASLNALAQECFVFENAYVSQPVCSPSRATMKRSLRRAALLRFAAAMTGLWPHTCGVPSCNVQPYRFGADPA